MERINENNQNSYYSEKEFRREEAYFRAEKRVKELKGFYRHLFWYLAVNILIIVSSIVVNSIYFNIGHFNAYSTAVFWGIGLGLHALAVFSKDIVFSKSWEERQMKKFMDKDRREWS